jgi:hypothetical protein
VSALFALFGDAALPPPPPPPPSYLFPSFSIQTPNPLSTVVCQEFNPGVGPTLASSGLAPLGGHSGDEMRYARLPLPGFSFPAQRAALRAKFAPALSALHPSLTASPADENDDDDDLISVLPDLTGWVYNGSATVNRASVNVWRLEDKEYDKVNKKKHTYVL